LLLPYVTSQEQVKASASLAVKAIDRVSAAGEKEITTYKTMIDAAQNAAEGGGGGLQMSNLMDHWSDIGVEEDAAWSLFDKAAVGALYSLIDVRALEAAKASATDTAWQRFVITRAQRQELLNVLRREFGPAIKAGVEAMKANRLTTVQGSAVALYAAVPAAGWKAKDE